MNARNAALCLMFISLFATVASAAYVEENFNNYGTTNAHIGGMGSAGNGWEGSWVKGNAGIYDQGSLSYTQAGYNNMDNQQGTNDGAIGESGGANFTGRHFSDTLGGTVWLSYIGYLGTDTYRKTSMAFSNLYFGVTANEEKNNAFYHIGYGGTYVFGTADYSSTDVHLVLAKVEFDLEGSNDRFTMWIDPDSLTGGEAGLGAHDLQLAGSNFTEPFNSMYVFNSTTSKMDALRFAYGDDLTSEEKLDMVLPEPTTLGLLAGGLGWLVMRRRR